MSWNINGLRSLLSKKDQDFIFHSHEEKELAPDIICLQEVRASDDKIPKTFLESLKRKGLHTELSFNQVRKGDSGVMTLSKTPPLKTRLLGKEEYDIEGRALIHEYEKFVLINGYFPNGRRDHSRVEFKLNFTREVLAQAREMKKPVIITGDLNTAHHPIDLARPKDNVKTTGFLPYEREVLSQVTKDYVDIFRQLHPNEVAYSWWSQRNQCRERNIGWRIDYFLLDKSLQEKVSQCRYYPEVMGSDHCPIGLDLCFD